jgi:hypothetical protein
VATAVQAHDPQRLHRLAHALGRQGGAVAVRLRQHHGERLAAVAGRLVDVSGEVAEHARDLNQHLVALLVAVDVVYPLEVVDVEHDEGERTLEAAAALDLAIEDDVQLSHVGETGELVRDGLSLHRLVEVGVLDRDHHHRLSREVLE